LCLIFSCLNGLTLKKVKKNNRFTDESSRYKRNLERGKPDTRIIQHSKKYFSYDMTLELGLKQGLMGQGEKKQEDWSEAFSVCLVWDEQTEEAMKMIVEKKKRRKRRRELRKIEKRGEKRRGKKLKKGEIEEKNREEKKKINKKNRLREKKRKWRKEK